MYCVNSKKKMDTKLICQTVGVALTLEKTICYFFLFIDKLKHVMLKLITNNQALPSFMES
jgi:hypothetical protein